MKERVPEEEEIQLPSPKDLERYRRSCQTEFWQEVFRLEADYLLKHLQGTKEVLSVGCGPAMIESALSERGFRVTGLDVSREALEQAPDSVRTVVACAEDVPFPESCFDAVIYVASLQFIADYRKALEEAARVLRPEGQVIVMLLNPASAFFKSRFCDPHSYVSRIKHPDLKPIEDVIAERFAVQTEYFLGVKGDAVFESAEETEAALFIIAGTRRTATLRKKSMKEIVIISGKGGTGKTSLTASFAVLAGQAVLADCDVDAADLHLVLSPRVLERHEFWSGREAVIRPEDCSGCGECLEQCRFGAVQVVGRGQTGIRYVIDPVSCEGCGVCVRFCPEKAIDFPERRCGEWMISETRCGPMVHARLGVAAENSGKLVSLVRREARRIAEQGNHPLVIVDGPPGIGCPVIASVTGADLVLAVTEPTVSGEHDLERVLSLARHFSIPTAVCVNKWDLNAGMTERIETQARQSGARIVGRIRYDRGVTLAQMREKAVVETGATAAEDMRTIWDRLGLEPEGRS